MRGQWVQSAGDMAERDSRGKAGRGLIGDKVNLHLRERAQQRARAQRCQDECFQTFIHSFTQQVFTKPLLCARLCGKTASKTATVSALLKETFLWEKQVKISNFIFMNKGTGMETVLKALESYIDNESNNVNEINSI